MENQIKSLQKIAIFLEGFKQGRGDILPLTHQDLVQLWQVIKDTNKSVTDYKGEKQLTLGQLIKQLQKVENPDEKYVSFDFGSAMPGDLKCWRGNYSHLALGYRLSGYGVNDQPISVSVNCLIDELSEAIGNMGHQVVLLTSFYHYQLSN